MIVGSSISIKVTVVAREIDLLDISSLLKES
jgi:hypothetical protein